MTINSGKLNDHDKEQMTTFMTGHIPIKVVTLFAVGI